MDGPTTGPAEQARQTWQLPDQYFRRILLLSVFLHVQLQHSSLACASLTVCDHIVEPCESASQGSRIKRNALYLDQGIVLACALRYDESCAVPE